MDVGLVALGIGLRLALIPQTDFVESLSTRVEVSTPITSYKRMREGVYLLNNNIDPYDGGVFHQPPLLLLMFHSLGTDSPLVPLLFVAIDVLAAVLLMRIARRHFTAAVTYTWRLSAGRVVQSQSLPQQHQTSNKTVQNSIEHNETDSTIPRDALLSPTLIAVIYLLNPLSIAACLSRSSLAFNSLAVIAAIHAAVTCGNRVWSMFFLSLATYLSIYPVMLVLPCAIFVAPSNKQHLQSIFSCAVLFSVFLLAWLGLSNLLMGSWNFIEATYGVIILVPDLTPNIGLSWYIFMEMFDQFRLFFLLVFQVFVLAFSVPLTLKFRQYPLFVVALFLIITATFKSYPSIGDVALYIPFVFMHHELFKCILFLHLTPLNYTKHAIPSLVLTDMKKLYAIVQVGMYASVLLPLFYNLWIYAGSGNANFFYAITLVVGAGQVTLIGDFVAAMVLREWERGGGWSQRKKRYELSLK
ncbi:hypothetical protein HK100_001646 [Physocladia obscura]|uniref:Uncharacterized protein n=1 Tax=Physocladia obscura TaxID=109957 RepID=A0AAD5SZ22_9FUNG|nr:hypothetical protein HK100_001646 [Physocladia obscura]